MRAFTRSLERKALIRRATQLVRLSSGAGATRGICSKAAGQEGVAAKPEDVSAKRVVKTRLKKEKRLTRMSKGQLDNALLDLAAPAGVIAEEAVEAFEA